MPRQYCAAPRAARWIARQVSAPIPCCSSRPRGQRRRDRYSDNCSARRNARRLTRFDLVTTLEPSVVFRLLPSGRARGRREPDQRVRSCSRWDRGPNRCDQVIMSLRRIILQQRRRDRLVGILWSIFAAFSAPILRSGVPAHPHFARGATDCRRTALRVPGFSAVWRYQRIFGKRDDVGPERESALAVAGRDRPRGVRRRQARIPMSAISAAGNQIDRGPAQIGRIGKPATGGKAGCRQAAAAIALTCHQYLEDGAQKPQSLIRLFGKRAVLLCSLLRLVKRNA